MKVATEAADGLISVRDLERQVEALKRDVVNLEKRKAELAAEANGIKLNVENDVGKRISESRKEAEKISEEREQLKMEREKLISDQDALKLEQVAVIKKKEEANNVIGNYKAMSDKLTRFIIMVKRESELI